MSRLPIKVKDLLIKSRDSATLAVEIYNKPSTKFRSYGFIILMIIAWTSLLQAIFEKRGVKYYYREDNSKRYKYIDGEKKAWELSECIKEYYKGQNSPVKDNLKFIIDIRNKIEHRFLPTLDLKIFGECQALLLNYEKSLVTEFGDEFSLGDSLAIPLQLLTISPDWRGSVLKEIRSREYELIENFVDKYRSSLDSNIRNSPEYNFKVFLIANIGNNKNTADKAVEFIYYDPTKPEEMKKYEKLIAFIKEKQVPVANQGKLKPSDVCNAVSKALALDSFSPSFHHAICWKYYNVRPESGSTTPDKTNSKYCQYDVAHRDYVYTEEWVKLLINELSDKAKRKKLFEA